MPAHERIAIVTTSYPANAQDPSGHFVASEARALAAQGHSVTVLAGGVAPARGVVFAVGAALAGESPENPEVIRIGDGGATGWPGLSTRLKERPARALGLVGWGLGVRRELQRRGPFQRVIGHWLVPTGFPILFAADFGEAKLELVVHGSDARLLAACPSALTRPLLLSLFRNARVRCVSHELADVLRNIAGQSLTGTLHVEPLPVDVSSAPGRVDAREQLGIRPEAKLVVIVSRLVSSKRVAEALAAAALLPDVTVVVVGDGPELAALERDHPRVSFVGRQPRTRALTWIAAADALLSASRLEGAPSTVREARALGVPVVASAAGDLARWSEHDPELWVVP